MEFIKALESVKGSWAKFRPFRGRFLTSVSVRRLESVEVSLSVCRAAALACTSTACAAEATWRSKSSATLCATFRLTR